MPATAANETIDAKKATQIARQQLHELFPRIPGADIALEEVELTGKRWEITLSYTKLPANPTMLPMLFGDDRIYKKFGVDKKTGEVLFMRIRKP